MDTIEMTKQLTQRILDKSIESFICAIEIYNKPTIRYRVEGFSFFICNAWELMLKAYLIKTQGPDSVYYKDSKDRTISLSECIAKVFTNDKDPLRINLEKIIVLRNTSTHFITQEFELIYVPLFQSSVFNFTSKIKEFHGIEMEDYISQNFLQLSVRLKDWNEQEIKAKYPEAVSSKILRTEKEISQISSEINNNNFAINLNVNLYFTKKKEESSVSVHIDNKAEDKIKIVREVQDINNVYGCNVKRCNELINNRLKKEQVPFEKFNKYHFGLFNKAYDIKNNTRFCYTSKINKNPQYSYSPALAEFIVDEIKRNPEEIIGSLKRMIEENEKNKPR